MRAILSVHYHLRAALLQGLLSKPLSLLRLADLVKFWLKSRLAATQRARARLWQDQTLEWGTVVPDDTIAALLGLVRAFGYVGRF